MLHSPLLKKNPDLYVFLPILYTVWSDAVLTPSEVATLEGLIDSQAWLKPEERIFLRSQLDPQCPPSPDEFLDWRTEIRKVTNSASSSLVDLGIKLAALHDDGTISSTLEAARPSLDKIESTLGLISYEAVYGFRTQHETITTSQSTRKSFDVNKMSQLLDGNHAELIKKVKTILSDPEFQYLHT
jgi:acyl-CoA oxidase